MKKMKFAGILGVIIITCCLIFFYTSCKKINDTNGTSVNIYKGVWNRTSGTATTAIAIGCIKDSADNFIFMCEWNTSYPDEYYGIIDLNTGEITWKFPDPYPTYNYKVEVSGNNLNMFAFVGGNYVSAGNYVRGTWPAQHCNKEQYGDIVVPAGSIIYPPIFSPGSTYGTMTDQEGNTYKTITIGTQTWMAENLRSTKYRNGDLIPEVENNSWMDLDSGARGTYNNSTDISQIRVYGRLYNFFTIVDSRNLAPTGWHVPTDAEWTVLSTYLGGESVAGGKLKETGTTHWMSPNVSANNTSGFTALPGGQMTHMFTSFGEFGVFWTSTEIYTQNAYGRYVQGNSANVMRDYMNKTCGFSVRCVKD